MAQQGERERQRERERETERDSSRYVGDRSLRRKERYKSEKERENFKESNSVELVQKGREIFENERVRRERK